MASSDNSSSPSNSSSSSSPLPPSPDSSPPAPSESSSPPPPNKDSPSPPPPSDSSPPPPPSDSSPPPPPSDSSPPPSPKDSSSPPPPDQNSNSSPSPPPPDQNSNSSPLPPKSSDNNNNYSPPPPPLKNSNSNYLPPPPTPKHGSGTSHTPPSISSDSSTTSSNDNSLSSSLSTQKIGIILGVVAGAGLLMLVMCLFLFVCCRKKKKQVPMYYRDHESHFPAKGNGEYFKNGTLKPPPGAAQGGWAPQNAAPPPPPQQAYMMSSDMGSSTFSGPHGPALPPPHPVVALGFNKSTFTYEELQTATGGFSQANLLGQGGFGYVHKGVLPNGKEIAVKSLKLGSGQGEREFQAEVEIISRVHHRYLVSLVGYCIAGTGKFLVYEYVPNNNLEFHLHGKDRPPLEWAIRMKIALGSAKGLAYLHEDCHPRIIHRDIKTANILLDVDFEAMVADFGLAKLNQDNHTHVSTRVMGTFGYLAPEYASSGKLTEKSDVFSFGVVLLELITGRRPIDLTGEMEDSLVDWARPLCSNAANDENYDQLADPKMERNYVPQEMACMVACAAACVRHSARRRPKMSQVVRALEGDVSLEDLHEGVKPGQSSYFGSGTSGEYEVGTYSANMMKLRKMALDSTEYGATSEYGLNPSSSSGDSEEFTEKDQNRTNTPDRPPLRNL